MSYSIKVVTFTAALCLAMLGAALQAANADSMSHDHSGSMMSSHHHSHSMMMKKHHHAGSMSSSH